MTAIPQRQRQRMLVALCCGIAAALMLPAGLVIGYNAVLNSQSGTNVNDVRTLEIASTPVALLATVNASNEITTINVIALSGGSLGGTIISVPVKASAEVLDGEAPRRISDLFRADDPAAFVADVEGLLDVSFSAVGILGRVELIKLLNPIGPVEILLDTDVRNTQADGTTKTVAKTGSTTINMATLVDILLAREIDQSESARFNHHKSVLTAVGNAVGLGLKLDDPQTSAFDEPLDIATFALRLFSGPIQVWQFAATAVPQGDANPNALDMYSVDSSEVTMIMASVAPTSITGSGESGALAVQIDSPFNNAVLSREIVRRLAAMGFDIALVREVPGPPQEVTQIRYVDAGVLSSLEDLASFVGDIETAPTRERAQGVDLQIILGSSFAVFVTANPDLPATTVVPSN
ncbi:MAG: hypothetical protein HQ486_02950 [Acidimicrobiaceae bacterium]|nr:hypothetical protein [Acidimicrobiaceae bacterium]